ncbi:MAG: PilX N-terminal domain-containing pilus assembly protein [Alysiella sp.]|uniref:pilus assembly PilX family protein n=1 Tax=Alysiella sp. TaxID=1872483 RepID=UPI0026DAC7AA|nr:PilX N-terminal domain-containing pilus assembly protein [Alysiella sp.]MDO4433496.1 PilX N-terminal domain-containing pilus assembly protein [Alysiella sp.]
MNVKHKQSGFSLFIVLVLMLVIAFLVIATNQASLTEVRASANEADRKLALSRAEYSLRDAEAIIKEEALKPAGTGKMTFTDNCDKGFCKPAEKTYDPSRAKEPFAYSGNSGKESKVEAWKRCSDDISKACQSGETVLDNNKQSTRVDNDGKRSYIIEYLGVAQTPTSTGDEREIFRITAQAHGDNEDTRVILQSYVELTRD